MGGETMVDRLQARAASQGERLALRYLLDGDVGGEVATLSFAGLGAKARAIGASLQGDHPAGARALLLYPPSPDFLLGFFGALHAGLTPVPAYPPDPGRLERSLPRLQAMVADCGASVVLTTRAIVELAPALFALAPGLADLRWVATDEVPDDAASRWRHPGSRPSDLAFLQYTSGSTGSPKGVMVRHQDLLANLRGTAANARVRAPEGHNLSWLPPYHDLGLLTQLLHLEVDGETTLMSPLHFLARPARWVEAISALRATCSGGPTFAYDLVARKATPELIDRLDLSSWEVAFHGGEPVRADAVIRFSETFARAGFDPRAHTPGYGMAETTLMICRTIAGTGARIESFDVEQLRLGRATPSTSGAAIVSMGPPADDHAIIAVDPARREALPDGHVGELWARGPSVTAGYWQQPDATAEVFDARLADGDGPWVRTGDLGFLRDGEVWVSGRVKDLLIVRGRKHAPQDVEQTAERAHPAVRPGCAAAFAEADGGREGVGLAFEVDPRQDADPSDVAARVRAAVAEQHELALSSVYLLRPGSLAKTSSGKVQRQATRAAARDGTLGALWQWRATDTPEPPRGLDTIRGLPAEPGSADRADALIAWLRAWAPRRLATIQADDRRATPAHVILDVAARGVFGLQAPVAWGGLALTHRDQLRVIQQIAALDLSLATTIGVHNSLALHTLLRHAGAGWRERLLPILASGRGLGAFAFTEPGAGANPRAIRTVAVPDGDGAWRLYGEKHWIGNAIGAACYVVFAQRVDGDGLPAGLVAFVVPEDTPGVDAGPEAMTMGVRGAVQGTVRLRGARVTDDQRLGPVDQDLDVADAAMTFSRWGLGAIALGAMKRCAILLSRYATRRTIGTGRLADHPNTRARLAELNLAIRTCEALITDVADALDSGAPVPVERFGACKVLVPELAFEAADATMQLLGGRGYMEPSGVPALHRDLRLMRIGEGPTEALAAWLGGRLSRGGAGALAALRGRGGDEVPSFLDDRDALRAAAAGLGPVDQGRAVAHGAGLLGAWAALAAAQDPADADARAWIRRRRDAARARVLADLTLAAAPASALTREADGWTNDIGDVDPRRPDEDWRLDPLLRGTPEAPEAGDAPALGRADADADAASDAFEAELATIVAATLGLDPEAVGVDVPLAELGLDSVAAVEVAAAAERRLGRPVSPSIAWHFPTIRRLAAHLAREPVAERGLRLEPAAPRDRWPLSFMERDALEHIERQPSQESYNLFFPLRAASAIAPDAVARALAGLVARHDNLRAGFARGDDGVPHRRVAEAVTVPFAADDLCCLPAADREARIAAIAEAVRFHRFDLATPPLAIAHLVRVSDDETLLLLLVSHLATDAWGLGLMLAELNHRLTALPGREDAPLPAPPLTAADVAVAWDDRFADVIRRGPGQFPPFPDLHLPLDRPRPPRPAARGARLIFPVSADLRARVEVAAREAGASFSIACLVAFQLAMHAATGADRVLFGVVRGNRPTGEVQQVVAHLVYAELFLGERPPGATGADLLGRAARFLGDAPLGEQPRAWMQLPPAVRVLFNFHNAALAPTAGPFVTAPDLSRFPYLWETQDVLWQVFSLGEGAVVSALYRDEVYEARTVEGLGEAFVGALEGLARGVEGEVG